MTPSTAKRRIANRFRALSAFRRALRTYRFRALWTHHALVISLILGGCLQQDERESFGSSAGDLVGLQTLAIDLPPLLSTENVALAAKERVALGDRTRVVGTSGSLTSVVAMGSQGSVLNPDGRIGNLYSRGSAQLRDRARVDGSVFTASTVSLGNGASIGGLTFSNFLFDPPSHFEWQVDVPSPTQSDIRLEPDQHLTVSPGRYRTVSVKSRSSITLSAGNYFIDALEVLEPQAKIRIDTAGGAVKLYVVDRLVFRGALENLNNPAQSDLLIVMLGQSTVFLEQPYSGFLIAPNATVQFRQTNSPHNGAFFAKQIVTDAGAVIQQRAFKFTDFFPTTLVVGPRRIPPHETGVGIKVPDGLGTDLGLPPGQRACDPGLELVHELNGIDPDTRIAYRGQATPPESCVVDFRACNENEVPLVPAQPNEQELNRKPALGSTCPGQQESSDCGVDPETVTWNDEFGICQSDADCVLFGKVCAKVCLKPGCTGSPDCIDPTCANGPQFRCAKRSLTCHAQPTHGPCEEIRECAEDDASGSPDPRQHRLTGMPPSNIDDPPAQTPPPSNVGPSRPQTYESENNLCNAPNLPAINADLVPEAEERDLIAGNDKWGIVVKPAMSFQADADPIAVGGQAEVLARASAGLDVGVRLWSKQYPVFSAKGGADFGTCKAQVTGSLVLVGGDIDPGPDFGTPPSDQSGTCTQLISGLRTRFGRLRETQSKAIATKKFTECVGPPNASNAAAWADFCQKAREFAPLPIASEGFVGFPANCSVPNAAPDTAAAWIDMYRHFRDREVQDLATLSNTKQQVFRDFPGGPFEFFNIDQSFTGFHFDFTYPVGPVTVSIELELVGSWGISGDVGYSAEVAPNTRIRTQASVRPRFDSSVIVFAGIGIGPVVVGIEGELLLLSVQTPVQTGVALRQIAIPDARTPFYPATANYAFSAAAVPGSPAGFMPFGPTLYDWEGEWTYGAAAHLETLRGQINLAAKIKLLFFTKKFSKKLARWDALFTMDKAFTGSISTSGDQLVLIPASDDPTFGTFFEQIPFVDPQFVKTHTFVGPGTTCTVPTYRPCQIIQ